MRNLGEVIDQMLAVIPDEETGLLADLARVKHAASYRAPEMAYVDWQACADCLIRRFGPVAPTEGWGLTVANIWLDRTPIEPTA